jgi:LAS superfamily LD-carboxypeptidase LdcB
MKILPSQVVGKSNEHIVMLNEKVGIHRQMLTAWQLFKAAATKQGFDLTIASGFRNYDRQLLIWNNKFSGKSAIKDQYSKVITYNNNEQALDKIHAILMYSALPGASRHHWGTDIDIYALNLLPKNSQLQLEPWEYQSNGYFYHLALWLKQNAQRFGFYFPYDEYRGGVAAEPWHLSYFPIAQQFQQQLSLSLIEQSIEQSSIEGKALLLANLTEIFQRYITNINRNNNE